MISQKNKQGWRNPWVFGLAAIMLSTVLVNGRLLWNAMQHRVQLLDENYSIKNHRHEAAWAQQAGKRDALGWRGRLHSPQQQENAGQATDGAQRFTVMASAAQFRFELSDRAGAPLQGGKVTIEAQRPGNAELNFRSELFEIAPGKYQGDLKFSRPGNWDLIIQARHHDNLFAQEQRVFVANTQ